LTERLKESVNVIKNDKELERVFITELPDWETKLTTAENNVKTMETDVRLNEELDNIKKMTDLEEQLKEIRKFEKINP
jgi:hypothetical protein